ncbi:uncharacterized protein LOC119665260, partial [Teleopsis dalmanni]|uniref:uncharacterized protein LOC119665260 n=1 Tax=Teleopsis dalmanni TaxID=139649 RepID=UPI0018CD6EE2
MVKINYTAAILGALKKEEILKIGLKEADQDIFERIIENINTQLSGNSFNDNETNDESSTLVPISIEAQFAVAAITSDITQFNTVVAAIESSVIADVSDAVLHPPETGRYANLKACIIERYSESEQRKIQRLLSEVELGDRRPTQLLTELTALAKDKVSDEFLKSLWLKRLPPQVRAILQASNVALAELAKLADRICEAGDFQQIAVASASDCPAYSENAVILRRLEQIEQRLSRLDLRRSESVQSRSSSRRRRRTRFRPGSHPDWCWYHE